MRNRAVSAIPSPFVVITTTIVYALLCPIFLMDNVYAEGGTFIVINDDKTMTYSQQEEVETECKSPCPSSAEICIAMCT
jgi:hypothetical protein